MKKMKKKIDLKCGTKQIEKGRKEKKWFKRKKNKGERRGVENIYKRNIRIIKFIRYTRKTASCTNRKHSEHWKCCNV
jgi:hypothetical protein